MKAVIKSVTYSKEWGEGARKVHYHYVELEGSGKKWNIASKDKNPSWLQPGATLEYEITDEAKGKIKRVAVANAFTAKKSAAPAVTYDSPSLISILDTVREEDIVFIDIETVRCAKELKKDTPLYEAWEYKNRYNNELERKTGEPVTLEEYFVEKAALYAPFAKVVAIVVGRIIGNELKTKKYLVNSACGWKEEVRLKEFNDDMNTILQANPSTVFVGWANVGFDQPFLAKRMYVNRIKPNRLLDTAHLKPWNIEGFDLKELWKGTSFYPDSLIAVAVAMGIPSPKQKLDGSKVGEAYYLGQIDDIGDYCELDVLTVANIYRTLKNKQPVTLQK